MDTQKTTTSRQAQALFLQGEITGSFLSYAAFSAGGLSRAAEDLRGMRSDSKNICCSEQVCVTQYCAAGFAEAAEGIHAVRSDSKNICCSEQVCVTQYCAMQ